MKTHNDNPGEAPSLPPSVPLLEKWDPVNYPALGWKSVPVDDWPADRISRVVYDMARAQPGKTFSFTGEDGTRYRVTWSVGPPPAASPEAPTLFGFPIVNNSDVPSVPVAFGPLANSPDLEQQLTGNPTAEANAASWPKLRPRAKHPQPVGKVTVSSTPAARWDDTLPKGPRDFAREAQRRLFPVRFDKDEPPTLPEVCIVVRAAVRGDNPAVVMPTEELREVLAMLNETRGSWHGSSSPFDTAVWNLVHATIGIVEDELFRREQAGAAADLRW